MIFTFKIELTTKTSGFIIPKATSTIVTIERNINASFESKGKLSKLKTNVTYDQNSNQLSVLQTSLRGSNQFYQCSKPVLIKEE